MNGFRTWDPVPGQVGGMSVRFIPYIDAGGDPVNYLDPSGKLFWIPVLAMAAASAAIDVAIQVAVEGKSLNCIDWRYVAFSAVLGGLGGAVGIAAKARHLSAARRIALELGVDAVGSTVGNAILYGEDLSLSNLARNFVSSAFGNVLGEIGGAIAGGVVRAGRGVFRGLSNLNPGRAIANAADNANVGRGMADVVDDVNLTRSMDDANMRGAQCNSFSADTLVSTTDGYLPISELQPGDDVLAYNESTGETGEYTITHTWEHDDTIVTLTIDGEIIETTPWHPFYTNTGWTDAANLTPGDLILSLAGSY